jgi:hypothetical protein
MQVGQPIRYDDEILRERKVYSPWARDLYASDAVSVLPVGSEPNLETLRRDGGAKAADKLYGRDCVILGEESRVAVRKRTANRETFAARHQGDIRRRRLAHCSRMLRISAERHEITSQTYEEKTERRSAGPR